MTLKLQTPVTGGVAKTGELKVLLGASVRRGYAEVHSAGGSGWACTWEAQGTLASSVLGGGWVGKESLQGCGAVTETLVSGPETDLGSNPCCTY